MKYSDEFFQKADSTVSLKGIENALKNSLVRYQPKDLDKTAQKLLSISGLHQDNFDVMRTVERLVRERLNDVSIDDNSNKNEKTVAAIQSEAVQPIYKAIGFDYLYRIMKEMYGKEKAVQLSGLMYDYSLGLSDSSNILKPYCYALDASKIVINGRDFGQLQSKPSKRVGSYISALCESIHQMSSHLAGAIAVGTFFFDIAHIMIYRNGIDDIEQEFQQFVHSVNHLSRNGVETPFTNISIFDYSKLKHIIKEDLSWYFPNESNMSDEVWRSVVAEKIMTLQLKFMDFFDKGDPSQEGLPYRFPVVTINFAKDSEGNILDTAFLKDITENYDIHRYNIFTSEGDKVASCCRLLSDSEMLGVAAQSNSFGAGAVASLGSHRVVTINFNRIALECNNIVHFWGLLQERIEDAKDILIAHRNLIKLFADRGLHPFISNGWINMKRMFSTIGVLGIVECEETIKRRFNIPPEEDIIGNALNMLNDSVKHYTTSPDIEGVYNIEQIPAESYAVRLATADKELFSEEKVPYEMYANQFVPLWTEANLWEKLKVDGVYNQMLTGGGIVHATIGERIRPGQAEEIIKYAASVGCEHFALNSIYSKCENGHVIMGRFDKCPQCNAQVIEQLTRVVGFFTPVSSWNKTRREWEFPRRTIADIN
jgi:ribonucleoside-triphosphate reductase